MHNVHERLAEIGDEPWADLKKTRQTITAEMRRRVGMKKSSESSRKVAGKSDL
ncbi:hypothetical protein ACFS4T_13690 [Pseudomonas lini]